MNITQHITCPITQKVFCVPVVIDSGHIFEE